MEALAYFGLAFVVLNAAAFALTLALHGPRIYAVLRMPEAVRVRLLEQYELARSIDLEDAII